MLCGHYEGIDQRVIDEIVDMELSVGDFVMTGGEIPAMTVIDTVSRLVPGVLAAETSYENESHFNGLLEYPQYTRPAVWHDKPIPDVLISGHHAKIEQWIWRNWQTRMIQVHVGQPMQVQVLLSAPKCKQTA